jgi:hypothetical protein
LTIKASRKSAVVPPASAPFHGDWLAKIAPPPLELLQDRKLVRNIRDLPPTKDIAPPYPPLDKFVKFECDRLTTASWFWIIAPPSCFDEQFKNIVLLIVDDPPLITTAPPPPDDVQLSKTTSNIQEWDPTTYTAPPFSKAEQFLKRTLDKINCPPFTVTAPPLPFVNKLSNIELKMLTITDPAVWIDPPSEIAQQLVKDESDTFKFALPWTKITEDGASSGSHWIPTLSIWKEMWLG